MGSYPHILMGFLTLIMGETYPFEKHLWNRLGPMNLWRMPMTRTRLVFFSPFLLFRLATNSSPPSFLFSNHSLKNKNKNKISYFVHTPPPFFFFLRVRLWHTLIINFKKFFMKKLSKQLVIFLFFHKKFSKMIY